MLVKNYLILGYPLEHSISPAIHNRAFEEFGLKFEYIKYPIKPENFDKEIKEILKNPNFIGGNITVPFKEKIINYIDVISEIASNIGAVNTFYKKDNLVYGDNTDSYGFLKGLEGYEKCLIGKIIVILGTGGSAKTVFHSVLKFEPKKIIMVSREKHTSQIFVSNKKAHLNSEKTEFIPLSYEELEKSNLDDIDCMINTTPIGMYEEKAPVKDIIISMMKKDTLVYDLIYNPPETHLLKTCKNYGMPILNGKKMLVFQAEKAFEIWTGKKFSEELIEQWV